MHVSQRLPDAAPRTSAEGQEGTRRALHHVGRDLCAVGEGLTGDPALGLVLERFGEVEGVVVEGVYGDPDVGVGRVEEVAYCHATGLDLSMEDGACWGCHAEGLVDAGAEVDTAGDSACEGDVLELGEDAADLFLQSLELGWVVQ